MSGFQQYTLLQMRQMLQQRVESVPFWVDAEANLAINEALLTWNSLTGFWRGDQLITTTINNWDYALSASIVFGTRVEYDNRPLAPTSLTEMDAGQPGWQGQTTADGGDVPTSPQKWLPLSIDMIAIWPADAVGGHTLKVCGIAQTPTLQADTDFIDIGAEEFNAILGYALHVLALKEGGMRFAATMPLFQEFLMEAAEENDQLATSSYFRQFIGTDQNRQEKPTHGTPTDYKSLQP
jgi:hypothetical protein